MAKDYELVGGQPVKVEPLEATEAGTYRAPLGKAYNPVTVPAGAGLPDVTTDDNGDILAVVSGEWAKSAPPLPAVTSDDNGDVLTVVEGEWAKAAPSGGQFIIAITPNDEETELSVDKTYQEIASAFAEGKTFYFYYPQYSTPFAAYCVYEDNGVYSIEGVYINIEVVAENTADIGIRKIYVTADSDNGVTVFSEFSFTSGSHSSIPPMN